MKSVIKICKTCGHQFTEIPKGCELFEDAAFGGYYWFCECGSTMFIPIKQTVLEEKVS